MRLPCPTNGGFAQEGSILSMILHLALTPETSWNRGLEFLWEVEECWPSAKCREIPDSISEVQTSAKVQLCTIRTHRTDGHYTDSLTNRFHVAVRLFSNSSQVTSECDKNKKVCHWCFYHILTSSVIYYLVSTFRLCFFCFLCHTCIQSLRKAFWMSVLAHSRLMAKTFCKTASL